MSIGGPSDTDTVSVAAGTLAIALMGAGAVHAFIEFRPVPGKGGSLTSDQALAAARARMHSRQHARELAGSNPVLARDLSAYAQLSPDRMEALRDWMMFG